MPVNQSIERRVRLVQRRIIENQNAPMQINLRLRLCPQDFRVGFEARQPLGERIVSRSVCAIGLTRRGFGGSYVARCGDNKVNVIFVSDFGRIHSLFLSNNYSTA